MTNEEAHAEVEKMIPEDRSRKIAEINKKLAAAHEAEGEEFHLSDWLLEQTEMDNALLRYADEHLESSQTA